MIILIITTVLCFLHPQIHYHFQQSDLLIPLLLLYFPFIALSDNRRGSLPAPISCSFDIPNSTKVRSIRPDSFPSNYAGTLANDRYSKRIAIVFSLCSEKNTKITLRIDNTNIDFNNGYLINDVTGSEASDNVTFQLIDDENNPIDLNQKNTFTKTIDESGTAYFNFFINYVKIDRQVEDLLKNNSAIF
ncbi:fimbrial protein [Proteus mirabilis]|uniref:fimbrial protein n=2 Tax=Proteus mirabilis TaxID=584 RepID=UPI001E5DE92C|nr:fimbrial protein [Proteus mirabilis]MCD4597968.1 fimbrial protein [Proteus mirabilis]